MASAATLLLSSTVALPTPASTATQRGVSNGAVRAQGWRPVQARGAWLQVERAQVQAGRRRRRGGVVCEVAVELGGSRPSGGDKTVGAGTRVRVLGPLKVYHVPKNPELDIGGMEGEVKEVVTTFKGKPVSATFPFKVQLATKDEGKKFFVHLKDDEFEVVE